MKDIEAQPAQPSAPPSYHPQILPQPASIIIKHETFDNMIKQENMNWAMKSLTPLLFQDLGHNILPVLQKSIENWQVSRKKHKTKEIETYMQREKVNQMNEQSFTWSTILYLTIFYDIILSVTNLIMFFIPYCTLIFEYCTHWHETFVQQTFLLIFYIYFFLRK